MNKYNLRSKFFHNCFLSTINKPNKSLKDHLKNEIKLKGPITLAEYMREALSNPIHVNN